MTQYHAAQAKGFSPKYYRRKKKKSLATELEKTGLFL